jgi:hypothetical protein
MIKLESFKTTVNIEFGLKLLSMQTVFYRFREFKTENQSNVDAKARCEKASTLV